jgi:hypothetical protein
MKFRTLLITVLIAAAILSCGKKTEQIEAKSVSENKNIERKYANSLEELNDILLKSLKENDKSTYLSYCFTEEQEESIADLLTDEKKQKKFKREFGFSLHEEAAYFENIVKYIKKTNIDLSKIDTKQIEIFDYDPANYAPINLKEVLIPIVQEGIERDIVYVAINIDGKWYFTSELSL